MNTFFFENFKDFTKNLLNLESLKIEKHSNNYRNYAAAYYQTLEEISGLLVPENPKKLKK